MRGRALGVLLLVLAAMSVVVVQALQPNLISGTAASLRIPGLPNVGDCVTEPITSSLVFSVQDPLGPYTYPELALAPCHGSRYGEVVAVLPFPVVPTVTRTETSRSVTDTNLDRCYQASAAFIGNPQLGNPIATYWHPTVNPGSSATQPLPPQRADGQRWLACLTFVQSADQMSQQSRSVAYTGTLRDALNTGNQRNLLGYCFAASGGIYALGDISSCASPHSYQQLAYGISGNSTVGRADVERTCADAVRQLTGLADITAGSALATVVDTTDNNGEPVTGTDLPPNTYLSCGINTTGDRLLGGSLLAIGDQPIPWA